VDHTCPPGEVWFEGGGCQPAAGADTGLGPKQSVPFELIQELESIFDAFALSSPFSAIF
jgi:hypothetical protein